MALFAQNVTPQPLLSSTPSWWGLVFVCVGMYCTADNKLFHIIVICFKFLHYFSKKHWQKKDLDHLKKGIDASELHQQECSGKQKALVPPTGFEHVTFPLRRERSTNWAKEAHALNHFHGQYILHCSEASLHIANQLPARILLEMNHEVDIAHANLASVADDGWGWHQWWQCYGHWRLGRVMIISDHDDMESSSESDWHAISVLFQVLHVTVITVAEHGRWPWVSERWMKSSDV